MRRADLAIGLACVAMAGCAGLPAWQAERPMFRDTRLPPEAAANAVATGRSTKADVASRLGEADRLAFDNGYEIWVYRERPVRKGQAELVVLFGPDGVARKVRVRADSTSRTGLR
jgi:hypothetical protein